jgi:hypothetical protein
MLNQNEQLNAVFSQKGLRNAFICFQQQLCLENQSEQT